MKKLVSLVLAMAMIFCCAIAELQTAEVTITPSYEGVYAEIDQENGLVVYVPADWSQYELEEDSSYMFCYGNDDIQLVSYLIEGDIDSLYAEMSASEDYKGFIVMTINGITWLGFSSADDCLNVAAINYADGVLLVLEFYTAEPMGESSLPAEILGSLTTAEALAE